MPTSERYAEVHHHDLASTSTLDSCHKGYPCEVMEIDFLFVKAHINAMNDSVASCLHIMASDLRALQPLRGFLSGHVLQRLDGLCCQMIDALTRLWLIGFVQTVSMAGMNHSGPQRTPNSSSVPARKATMETFRPMSSAYASPFAKRILLISSSLRNFSSQCHRQTGSGAADGFRPAMSSSRLSNPHASAWRFSTGVSDI